MTSKTRKSNRQIVADARRLLRNSWVKSRWVVFEDDNDWSPGEGMAQLNHLLEDAKKKSANPKCHVCAEGAVYLACALAGDTTEDRAAEIISTLDQFATGGDIIAVNDKKGLKTVLAVFDKAEKEGAFGDA